MLDSDNDMLISDLASVMPGMIITFGFLVLYTAVQPYCTPGLSKTQACALISQFISLFSGLCLVIESYIQRDLINAGEVDTTNQSIEIFGALIISFNLLIAAWPIVNVLISAEFAENADHLCKKLKGLFKQNKTAYVGIDHRENHSETRFQQGMVESASTLVTIHPGLKDDSSYTSESVLGGAQETISTDVGLPCTQPFSPKDSTN
jgi:hypothetical protein